MPLFSLSWTLLVLAGVFVGLVVVGVLDSREEPKQGWHVVTVPADKQVETNYGTYEFAPFGKLQLSRSVLVQVERGKQSLTIAALDIGADDFEEQISNAQAQAHAKAASLNAYVGAPA